MQIFYSFTCRMVGWHAQWGTESLRASEEKFSRSSIERLNHIHITSSNIPKRRARPSRYLISALPRANLRRYWVTGSRAVAISRAKCLAVLVANPKLLDIPCNTPEQMGLVNTLCWAANSWYMSAAEQVKWKQLNAMWPTSIKITESFYQQCHSAQK